MSSTTDTVKRPEPVMNAATLAGAIAAVIITVGGLLRGLGFVTDDVDLEQLGDQASDAVLAVGVLWATVGPWLLARLRARDQVTPLKDPRDAAGNPLYPNDLAELIERFPDLAGEARAKLDAGLSFDIVLGYLDTLSRRPSTAPRTGSTAHS